MLKTTLMTPEELLKPRYEVIADYPKSPYPVGTILNAATTSEDCIYCDREGPRWRHYPHLFRRLAWWEHRKPEDMPAFVKDKSNGKVYKVADPSQNGRIWHIDNEIEHRFITRSWYTPATSQQYEEYLKLIK